jgi:hypothetical protein
MRVGCPDNCKGLKDIKKSKAQNNLQPGRKPMCFTMFIIC